jgi:GntR family transcriptional regulator, transcriptional repressor for pyruvate dehydrogenase complex
MLPSLSLPRVSRTSLVDEVISTLQRMLGEDRWPAGAKLPSELELSRQLGVGRSTVREALRVLGHLGVVESRSGLGTFVCNRKMPASRVALPWTPEALKELYEFRRMVEVPAARTAAEARTDAEMRRIEAAWRDCDAAVIQDSALEFARLDFHFHLSIVEASHNRFLVSAFKSVEEPFVNYVNVILGMGPLRSMLKFHDGLIAAIRAQDPDAATAAAEENFRETDVRIRLFLRADSA